MLAIKVLNKSEVKFKIMALGKGTASKSTTGASMSKYDVEVEGRLKALEAAVAALEKHSHDTPAADTSGDHELLVNLEQTLRDSGVI